jgi:hypothetical protein
MSKSKRTSIEVQGTAITIVSQNSQDYISLTDMAKKFGDDVLIYSWMRNRNTLEFIGVWEQIHNPDFKGLEFETFKNQAGLNSFSLTRANGSKQPVPSDFNRKLGATAAELTPTKTLPSSSALGLAPNSSSTSSMNSNA